MGDRITVRGTTGYSAFRLMYGRGSVLPVETSIASLGVVDWNKVRTIEDLVLARMRQLDERVLDEAWAVDALEQARRGNKKYFDRVRGVRGERLKVCDLAPCTIIAWGNLGDSNINLRTSGMGLIAFGRRPRTRRIIGLPSWMELNWPNGFRRPVEALLPQAEC